MSSEKLLKGSPLKSFFTMFIGAVIYGISIGLFLAPNHLAPGGVGGLSVILSYFIPLGVGSLTMIINLPLLILAIVKWGWKFLFTTVTAIIASGITADICSLFSPITENKILASIAGGAVMGLGCGIVFRSGSTTGGTDIVTRIIKSKKPHLKLNVVMLIIDSIIAVLSGLVFKNADNALYSLISLTVFSKVLDMVLYGSDTARMVFVISGKSQDILDRLLNKVGVGCTILKGVSGYQRTEKEILLCAMKKQRLPSVKKAVLEIDDKAFMLVTSAGEVFGEGFKTEQSDFF